VTVNSPAPASTRTARRTSKNPAYSVLIGLTTLGVLLQGLWAGIFLEHDGDRPDKWVNVHARGAEVTIILCILALIACGIWLRHRRDLLIGTAVLAVALVVEAYIGGRITDDGNDTLTAVHVPLAMAVMGLAVWLPFRARSSSRASQS
jgi:hypothetical protein